MVLGQGYQLLRLCWLLCSHRNGKVWQRKQKDRDRFESSKSLLGPDGRCLSAIYRRENLSLESLCGFYLNFSVSKYPAKHLFLKNGMNEQC